MNFSRAAQQTACRPSSHRAPFYTPNAALTEAGRELPLRENDGTLADLPVIVIVVL